MDGAIRPIKSTLRKRILGSIAAIIVVSLAGSFFTLYRITSVQDHLKKINQLSVPLERQLTQLKSDSEVLNREMLKRLGYVFWDKEYWNPQKAPRWLQDIMVHGIQKTREVLDKEFIWENEKVKQDWNLWIVQLEEEYQGFVSKSDTLYNFLFKRELSKAAQIYPDWKKNLMSFNRKLNWGIEESEALITRNFNTAQTKVQDLKMGLQILLISVFSLSLLVLWLGERALRPLGEIRNLVREVTRRGVRKEDKSILPQLTISRNDEVSQLAVEFNRMATALLEREKTVDLQKDRLEDQNQLLRQISTLNKNILNSIESVLIVTDLEGKITHLNPKAIHWLETQDEILGRSIHEFSQINRLFSGSTQIQDLKEAQRIETRVMEEKTYGGMIMPLHHEGNHTGAIFIVDDLSEQTKLEDRLRVAENLAAVGRMSAQVAHEVRNPLHSIGLESEMALEAIQKDKLSQAKMSLQSIQEAVDRLESITENYLKLSKLSSGKKESLNLGQILENVLAGYASTCEKQNIKVDWKREKNASFDFYGDSSLLEQVFGNLFRNSIQALESVSHAKISWALGNTENGKIWISVKDNGGGIPNEVQARIFEPFVTTKAQGTGLGLPFIKKVVEDHNGEIRYRNRKEGGACFEMLFPMNHVSRKKTKRDYGENTLSG